MKSVEHHPDCHHTNKHHKAKSGTCRKGCPCDYAQRKVEHKERAHAR